MKHAIRHVGDDTILAVDGSVRRIARVRSISYATRRSGKAAVWQHDFEAPVWLCEAGGSEPAPPARDGALIGWVVDLDTDKGRVLLPGYAAVNSDGELSIASVIEPRYCLLVDPSVTVAANGEIHG